ncbi:uncharacterized protein LOC108666570 [Hyalella azteca]|uniref:Uncharacterized protein LOC108666570 n=1 Tax=Hyalella azteca TaxID=294128 RepID=A0A8B7N6R8_HYAAZ|nr:uncharacterized protein LOC108666570 [Hyalella azteca]
MMMAGASDEVQHYQQQHHHHQHQQQYADADSELDIHERDQVTACVSGESSDITSKPDLVRPSSDNLSALEQGREMIAEMNSTAHMAQIIGLNGQEIVVHPGNGHQMQDSSFTTLQKQGYANPQVDQQMQFQHLQHLKINGAQYQPAVKRDYGASYSSLSPANLCELGTEYYATTSTAPSGGTYATLAPRNRSRQQPAGGSHSYTLHRPPPLPKAPPTAPGSSPAQRPDITRDLVSRDKSCESRPEQQQLQLQGQIVENFNPNLAAVESLNDGGNKPDLTNHIMQGNLPRGNVEKDEQLILLRDFKSTSVYNGIPDAIIRQNMNNNRSPSHPINVEVPDSRTETAEDYNPKTGRRSSRRGRSSSERTAVSQLFHDDKDGQSRQRQPPSSDRSVGSPDGSGSRSSSSSLSGRNKSPKRSKRPSASAGISEYLNTDTIRRSGPLTASQQVVFSSSYSPPTIYYTTRPARNVTPEKYKRKKSLGSYPNEDLRSRRNSKSRSREELERNSTQKPSAKFSLENMNSVDQL